MDELNYVKNVRLREDPDYTTIVKIHVYICIKYKCIKIVFSQIIDIFLYCRINIRNFN